MCQTSLFKAAYKKEVKEQANPKGMRETLMLFGGQQKQGGENPRGRL
jgi:hypothetical protein